MQRRFGPCPLPVATPWRVTVPIIRSGTRRHQASGEQEKDYQESLDWVLFSGTRLMNMSELTGSWR
jgi:hypothetical protein